MLINFTERFINICNVHLSRVVTWYKNVLRVQLNFTGRNT